MAQTPRPLRQSRIAPGRPARQSVQSSATAARHIRLLKTLNHVLNTIAGTPHIEREVQSLASEIGSRFQFTTVGIGVVEGDDLVFRGVVSRDMPRDFSNPVSRGICGRVVRSGIGELVSDVHADPDYVAGGGQVECEVCVPIFVGGDVWGVINIEAAADVALGSEELDVMRTLASSIGLAIERSRQLRAEANRLDQLAHLQRIAGRIAGRVDIDGDGEDILEEIIRVFGYSSLGLAIVRGGIVDVYYAYASLLDGSAPYRSGPITGIVARVARTGEPVFIRDVRDDPDYVKHRPDTTQEICVPVRSAGSVIGILNVESTEARQLDASDLDILLTVADHLGTAISNHRRIAELEWRNQQMRLVDRVASLIASQITIRDAFSLVLAEIEGAFGYGTSGIGLIEGDRLVFAATRDSSEESVQDYFQLHGVSIDTGVTGRVARTGEPAFIEDVRSSPDYLVTSPEIQYEICVPIQADGRTVGVLNVETPASKPLGIADFEILSTIANRLGMAFARSTAYEAERRSRTTMEAIQRVSMIVSSTLDPEEALRRIVATLAAAFDYPFVSISLTEGTNLAAAAWHGLPQHITPPTLDLGSGVAGRVAQTGHAELVLHVSDDDARFIARADTRSQIAVPIYCAGEPTGVLSVEGDDVQPLSQHDHELLQTFAEHAGTTIANARRFEQMQQHAMRDPITDLPNYRQFQTRLRAELARAARHERPLALLVIDLDGFKSINDVYGHLVGDEVLRGIGARLSTSLRESDIPARYAGDEFVVILPETTDSFAHQIANRLSTAITSQPFPISTGHDVAVALSIGVAAFPDDASTVDDLIRAADSAMYRVKRSRDEASSSPPD